MEKIVSFIKANYIPMIAGLFFYLLFLYYNTAGNSLCDCESTEKYNPNTGRSHYGVNRFYHK